jgi:outer membrane protein assembly factor BamA
MSRAWLVPAFVLLGCATASPAVTPTPAPASSEAPPAVAPATCPTAPPKDAAFDPARVFGARVEKVCLLGAGDETSLRLKEAVAPREGTTLDAAAAREDLSELFATGLIHEARVFGQALPSKGVLVTYVVVERALVTAVRVEGAPSLSAELRHELEVKGFRDTASQRARLRDLTLGFYEALGHAEAALDFETKPAAGGVELVMKVTEGRRMAVQALHYEGAKGVPARELEKLVQTKVGGPVREELLEQDRQRLSTLYLDRGFVMATVNVTRLTVPSGATDITFAIDEGALFRVGAVDVKGLPPGALKGLETKKGVVFSRAAVRRDLDRLRTFAGKLDVEVLPLTEVDAATKTIRLTFEVSPR